MSGSPQKIKAPRAEPVFPEGHMIIRRRQSDSALVLTIALAIGVMSFDQGSLGYLLPFIQPELGLTNTQVGMVASTYWVAFAVGSYGSGIRVDKRGHARGHLVTALVIFGVCSLLSSLTVGWRTLLAARAATGLFAGAILTLAQLMLGLNSSPTKVGANMGVATGLGGSLSGLVIAPVALIQIASVLGWRASYPVVLLSAAVAAYGVKRNLREPISRGDVVDGGATNRSWAVPAGLLQALQHRNIVLCGCLCSLYVAYVSLGMTFLPPFFVGARGFSPTQMSGLIAVLGTSSLIFSIILPFASDRVGRKPVLLVACGFGALAPLSAFFFHGPILWFGLLLFVGWSMAGTGSFFMGIIPSETIEGTALSGALGAIISIGVLLGGLVGPLLAGWGADHWGAGAPLLIQGSCSALAVLVTLGLRETARTHFVQGRGP